VTARPGWAWRDTDVVMVAVTTVLGFSGIAGAWFGADGASSLAQQAMWLNVAVAAFAVSGVGLCLWLMRGRRAVGERRAGLVSLDPVDDEPPAAPARVRRGGTGELTLVRATGMRRVHDPSCPLVEGKHVEPATLGDGEPCAVCEP